MTTTFERKLARLSICPCGFPALKDEIPLGQIYQIPRFNFIGVHDTWICGGCGAQTVVHCIMVIRDGNQSWLPKELFDWDDLEEAHPKV